MSYKTADDLYREDYKSDFIVKNVETYEKKEVLNLKWETIETNHTADPRIWGPALWFYLHISSFHYAIEASDIAIEKMKGFILGIPYLIPCQTCAEHANSYIISKYSELDNICSGRKQLFDFFVHIAFNISLINSFFKS